MTKKMVNVYVVKALEVLVVINVYPVITIIPIVNLVIVRLLEVPLLPVTIPENVIVWLISPVNNVPSVVLVITTIPNVYVSFQKSSISEYNLIILSSSLS